MSQKLSNIPYKGCTDYFPEDFERLQYIFSCWREVAHRYGYQEYLTPVLENAEIYEAKSGEDVKRELYTLTDQGGRRLSLRPEMTPSVTRMVTRFYGQAVKPLRLFSIANFFRGERPQKGRGREFWQLNADIFGEEGIAADLEVLLMAVDMILAFNPPQSSFVLKLNNRKLIEFLFSEILVIDDSNLKAEVTRKMDKWNKLGREEFEGELSELGLSEKQVKDVVIWMTFSIDQLELEYPEIVKNLGFMEIQYLIQMFEKIGYEKYITYGADLIRGFDYYDGTIFEIFDLSGEFKRSLFGGGRYNGLAGLFGSEQIPAVGFAPGDMSVAVFLDNWNLWPDFDSVKTTYFLPLLQEENLNKVYSLATQLRNKGLSVEMGTAVTTISKALSLANRKSTSFMIIFGTDEMKSNVYKVKNMKNGEEITVEIQK